MIAAVATNAHTLLMRRAAAARQVLALTVGR
jgi:hypothetical protein